MGVINSRTYLKARGGVSWFSRIQYGKSGKDLIKQNFLPRDKTLETNTESRLGFPKPESMIPAGILKLGIRKIRSPILFSQTDALFIFMLKQTSLFFLFDPGGI